MAHITNIYDRSSTPPPPGRPIPSNLIFQGHQFDLFRFYDSGRWWLADTLIDNGENQGYSAYIQGVLIGHGHLLVFDSIDKEVDLLKGGPLGFGWSTHFPPDYEYPPAYAITHYRITKQALRREFRNDMEGVSQFTGRGGVYAEHSRGQNIHHLAPSKPLTFYGLGEREESSKQPWCIGFAGGEYYWPTLVCNLALEGRAPPRIIPYVEPPLSINGRPASEMRSSAGGSNSNTAYQNSGS
ncbi:hypothetical protein F4824DRAFT_500518 [Ustulina deusta]|nr:hypothetical protein F4823DRAFT_632926 [Ustulina deusta]KAI3336028.1 hypothetical protein F4824DRAFT_500518 [Ustulina deusta]